MPKTVTPLYWKKRAAVRLLSVLNWTWPAREYGGTGIANLKETVELFVEYADPVEIKQRLHSEMLVTRFEAAHE